MLARDKNTFRIIIVVVSKAVFEGELRYRGETCTDLTSCNIGHRVQYVWVCVGLCGCVCNAHAKNIIRQHIRDAAVYGIYVKRR